MFHINRIMTTTSKFHCLRCGGRFSSVLPDGPKACARCNSPLWRVQRRNAKGQGRRRAAAVRCGTCGQIVRKNI